MKIEGDPLNTERCVTRKLLGSRGSQESQLIIAAEIQRCMRYKKTQNGTGKQPSEARWAREDIGRASDIYFFLIVDALCSSEAAQESSL